MRRPGLIARKSVTVSGALLIGSALASSLSGCSATARLPVTLAATQSGTTEYVFDPEPLRLPPRTAVNLTFNNLSDAPHTLIMLEPIDAATAAAISAGGSTRLEFKTPDAGTYRFVCNVHEGMGGTLIVE